MRPSSKIPPELVWPARILILSLLVLAGGLLIHPLGDPDVYLHLRDGRYLIESGLQVSNDPFSYSASDQPFDKIEMLFRVGIYLAWKIGGYNFLILLKALAMTMALFLLGLLVYRRWPHFGVTAFLMGLAVLAPLVRFFPERPYVFTYLFLPLVLLWLEEYRSADPAAEPKAGKKLMLIPVLGILWVNLHPGFIVLFGFLGAQILEQGVHFLRTRDFLAFRRLRCLSLTAGAAFLAGALNPMGFKVYAYVIRHIGASEFMQYITEWAPPTFMRVPSFFLLLGLAWLIQILCLRRARLSDLILLIVFSYLAVKSIRNIPLFVIAALPPLAGHLRDLWKQWVPRLSMTIKLRRMGLLAGSGLAALLLILAASLGYALRLEELPHIHPAAGLAWLQEHALKGRLLTHDRWGGYVGWMTHGKIKVFMDGRLELFGEELYADYRNIIYGEEKKCLALLDHYRIQGLLISPQNERQLFQRLRKSGRWAMVYWDHVSIMYVRREGLNNGLIEKFAYQAVDPVSMPHFYNPAEPELALQEIRRAVQTAPHSYLPLSLEGSLLLINNDLNQARRVFEQALVLAPRHFDSHFNLGLVAYRENKLHEAEQHMRRVWRLCPTRDFKAQTCHLMASIIKQDYRRRDEALQWARRALKFRPGWKPALALVLELRG
jgi:tetratricopeptide (TPR) repeat protein